MYIDYNGNESVYFEESVLLKLRRKQVLKTSGHGNSDFVHALLEECYFWLQLRRETSLLNEPSYPNNTIAPIMADRVPKIAEVRKSDLIELSDSEDDDAEHSANFAPQPGMFSRLLHFCHKIQIFVTHDSEHSPSLHRHGYHEITSGEENRTAGFGTIIYGTV